MSTHTAFDADTRQRFRPGVGLFEGEPWNIDPVAVLQVRPVCSPELAGRRLIGDVGPQNRGPTRVYPSRGGHEPVAVAQRGDRGHWQQLQHALDRETRICRASLERSGICQSQQITARFIGGVGW